MAKDILCRGSVGVLGWVAFILPSFFFAPRKDPLSEYRC